MAGSCVTVALGLGTNQGDRIENLQRAIGHLTAKIGKLTLSNLYESQALLCPGSPPEWNRPYLNMAACAQTSLRPEALLAEIKSIEKQMGRDLSAALWSPRIIDIDILLYGDLHTHSPTLTIPHPHLNVRPFAFLPLKEISPDYTLPATLHEDTKIIGRFA